MILRLCLLAMAFAAAALGAPPPAHAAFPSVSRGEHFLPIDEGECMARAQRAFRVEGWGAPTLGGRYVRAVKDIHHAFITCNAARDGGTVVNIFVASDAADENVPGAQRVQLQQRMNESSRAPEGAGGGCRWIDGPDSSNPADPGRGVRNANAHRDHVLRGNGGTTPGLVEARLRTLHGCLPRDRFAQLYAEASVMIAGYGRAAGWRDGMDANAPSEDSGRGVSNYNAHYGHVMNTGGATTPALVSNRLRTLAATLRTEDYAALYAALSVLIARYAT